MKNFFPVYKSERFFLNQSKKQAYMGY